MTSPGSFAAAFVIVALFTRGFEAQRRVVTVTVFYESKGEASRDFVVNQLLPAVLRAPDLIRPVLIPYGNATTTRTPGGYEFSCQHGEEECHENKLHACAFSQIDSARRHVTFAACMMSLEDRPRRSWARFIHLDEKADECLSDMGLSQYRTSQCAGSHIGNLLLSAYGEKTDRQLNFVPTVLLNEEYRNQTAVLTDLWGEISQMANNYPYNPVVALPGTW